MEKLYLDSRACLLSTANLEMNCDLLENMYRRLRTAKTTSRSLDDNSVVKCSIDE